MAPAPPPKLDRPAAGKTGTTENNGDAWFAGYTPNYAAVVWMGYPEATARAMDNVHGITVTGGTLPAQIWQQFMAAALSDIAPDKFPDPPQHCLAAPAMNTTLTVSPDEWRPRNHDHRRRHRLHPMLRRLVRHRRAGAVRSAARFDRRPPVDHRQHPRRRPTGPGRPRAGVVRPRHGPPAVAHAPSR